MPKTTSPRSARKAQPTRKPPPTPAREPVVAPSAPKPLGGKLAAMATLLSRPEGATLVQLTEATGWQTHSVRGALAGALKKHGYVATSSKADGVRTYRLPSAIEVQP